MRNQEREKPRTKDPVFVAGPFQRVRIIFAIVCVGVAVGLLLWKVMAD